MAVCSYMLENNDYIIKNVKKMRETMRFKNAIGQTCEKMHFKHVKEKKKKKVKKT